jgi:Holliday junction resolvase RusA-like endonuclease
MTELQFVVAGLPAPQGSKKYVGHRFSKKYGKELPVLVESSRKVDPWRRDVTAAATAVRPSEPMTGPIVADMVFSMPRPKGHFGTGRNAGLLRPSAPAVPFVMPDLSKLARSTEDALKGIIWHDDSLVVAYGRLAKVYAGSDDPDALDAPGAVIRVRPFIPTAPGMLPGLAGAA